MSTVNPSVKNNLPSFHSYPWRRQFSKILCFLTLFLIFVGGMVKSTDSGLAVPDWPLSYGTLFPPMVGGVFYEHSHRMVAGTVGLSMLVLAMWLWKTEKRRWVKILGFSALMAVVLQGILGGLTVLFFLPDPISIAHALLAQTFFILTIILAYSQSLERSRRETESNQYSSSFIKFSIFFILLIFWQLFLGALMRHTESGLAIPDFPKMGGYWLPSFNQDMLDVTNTWRLNYDLPPVTATQVLIHFSHRMLALIILIAICILNFIGLECYRSNKDVIFTLCVLDSLITFQVILGALTVLTQKNPLITSLHVMIGAAVLGASVLLLLRAAPLKLNEFKKQSALS